jgi:hypothetical protein
MGRAALSTMKAEAPQATAEAPKIAQAAPERPDEPANKAASLASVAPPKAAATVAATPAAASPVDAAPISGPARVGGIALESIEALADLPTDVHRMLVRAATIETLQASETRVDFGAALVIAGQVSVRAKNPPNLGVIADAPAFVPSRGSLPDGYAWCLVAGPAGATIARWTSAFFEETLGSCSWVLDDCHAMADRLQARVGLALGALAELDATTRDRITEQLEMRIVSPAEVVAEENASMPGLVFVVAGALELMEGEVPAVVGEVRPGEPLFPDALWAGAPTPLTSRAAASGALLLVADRRAALSLAENVPLVGEILSR